MELSYTEGWTVVYGLVLGTVFLLAFAVMTLQPPPSNACRRGPAGLLLCDVAAARPGASAAGQDQRHGEEHGCEPSHCPYDVRVSRLPVVIMA